MKILESASKVILLIFGLVMSLTFMFVVVRNGTSENVVTGVMTMFASAVSCVMTYYFTKRAKKPEEIGGKEDVI